MEMLLDSKEIIYVEVLGKIEVTIYAYVSFQTIEVRCSARNHFHWFNLVQTSCCLLIFLN